jgi:dihydrofolate synthase/folylpolyglutamate synthase
MTRLEFDKWIAEIRRAGIKPGLSRVKALLNRLDNPQDKLDIIHISGTNGKGSTATILSRCLNDLGYSTGQFSSPSILGLEYMFLVEGQPISTSEFLEIAIYIKEICDQMLEEGHEYPTEYELYAAMMYFYFYKQHVDFAVVEVAMGGENDCTNVMSYSILSIMTAISLDHSAFLGDTLLKIVKEKSGIIKSNSICITHPQEDEVISFLTDDCDKKQSVLKILTCDESLSYIAPYMSFDYKGGKIESLLVGGHQKRNIIGVLMALEVLSEKGYIAFDSTVIKSSIKSVSFEARFENIGDWLLDGAHNHESLIALSKSLELVGRRENVAIIGVLRDKDIDKALRVMQSYIKEVYATEPKNPRALDSESLKLKLESLGYKVVGHGSITEGVEVLKDKKNKLAFGSFYMLEELRQYIQK